MRRSLFLLACAAAAGQLACHRAPPGAAHKRIIVLGIDAMDPAFLERHWDALPNLDRLRREGEFRRLGTTIPPQSPVAWSTFATGMDPGGHGVFDFIHRHPETMLPFSSMAETEEPKRTLRLGPYIIPISSGRVIAFRKGRAFWQMLDERGIPVTILRIPNNFPPVECEGRQLSGMGTPDLRGTFGTFSYYTDDPLESDRQVSGGHILRVELRNHRATLKVEGPDNTLREGHPRTFVSVTADVDPAEPVARFSAGDTQLILRQGEWSDWIRVAFPLIEHVRSAAGMIRIFAQQLKPGFRVYISPVNIDPSSPALPISTPSSYSRELESAIGPFYTQGIAEDTAALREGALSREEYRRQSCHVADEQFKLLHHAVSHFGGGLLFFHFLGVDQDSHMLWGKYEDELLDTYRRVDREVGRVLEKARGATVIVMSDHGFSSFDRAVHLNTWLMREGFLMLDNPENTSDEEMFPHVVWSRTEAYSLGLNGVYLNLAGREKYGSVQPGEEADGILRKLAVRLAAFRDSGTGKAVVDTVYLAKDVYHGDALASAPDIIVGWAPGFRSSWQTALGAVPRDEIVDNREEWRGDHCIAARLVPGVFLSNRRSRLPDPRLEDLTVTLLAEFGVKPAPGMTGRPMF